MVYRINKLRKSGIKITGIRNLGYRLDAESNELNKKSAKYVVK